MSYLLRGSLSRLSKSAFNNVYSKRLSSLLVGSRRFSSAIANKLEPDPGHAAMDGNEAAAYSAYACVENSFIYPITPATSMGELMDEWSTDGKKNIFGDVVNIRQMQSEGGAAGALHGAVIAGNMATSFTSSQGLLLKIPNMYIISGELGPAVIHVATRQLTKHALSIHGDHQDIMAARQTGWAMLCGSCPQEVMDFGVISHIATLKARIPFMNFFDGMRTSAQIQKLKPIPHQQILSIFPIQDMKDNLRKYQATPHNPLHRGLVHNPDVYFQNVVGTQRFYDACPGIVESTMKQIKELTGREYNLFDYFGAKDASKIIIVMGSAFRTVQEVVEHMNEREGSKLGVIGVRLFRPWSKEHLRAVIPDTVKKIAVLDRSREEGSAGLPLYLDVLSTILEHPDPSKRHPIITGGQFAISGKEFTPAMTKAVFDNLDASTPKDRYTIGIKDDVTHTSLDYGDEINTVPESIKQCIFWGLGGDGTLGANKSAISMIGNETKLKAQGFFEYDSYKTDGATISHLRFGPQEIKSEYKILNNADYISCNQDTYVKKYYDMVDPLKEGGTFVLNSRWNSLEALEAALPNKMKITIAKKNAKVYNIDAAAIAREVGLGRHVNMIMQSAFFTLSGVLPIDEALQLLKSDVEKMYRTKGASVIKNNIDGVDRTASSIQAIEYPREKWLTLAPNEPVPDPSFPHFFRKVCSPVLNWKGDDIPVSEFDPAGLTWLPCLTQYEKRGIAADIPIWEPDTCTNCNYCSLVCPHAAIRPFLLTKDETKKAPKGLKTKKADVGKFNYSMQVSPLDCTGCGVCAEVCPSECLFMTPVKTVDMEKECSYWDYDIALPYKPNPSDKETIKGSQFEQPLFEFSGACSGCGETPYIKLATQLFGSRMVIAAASGCVVVYSGMFPHLPYATRKENSRGPAYTHSLFEDNAEYGYGLVRSNQVRRERMNKNMGELIGLLEEGKLKEHLVEWRENMLDVEICEDLHSKIPGEIEKLPGSGRAGELRDEIIREKDLLTVNSYWIVGGDGWAYDIGYGGLDHILNTDGNFNVLVMDNEMYANTGGQASKATQMGASVKFSLGGKNEFKKDLGRMAMAQGNVYVASIALGANYQHALDCMLEADSYPGPSLILAFSPCIGWGMDSMKESNQMQKLAVDSGYWPIYSFDPRKDDGQKFQLHSQKIRTDISEFLKRQIRFRKLQVENPEKTKILNDKLQEHVLMKHDMLKQMSLDDEDKLEYLTKKIEETGI